MDEVTNARLTRDIARLRDEHATIALADPMASLTEIANRYGIEIDMAMKLWSSDGAPDQASPSVH